METPDPSHQALGHRPVAEPRCSRQDVHGDSGLPREVVPALWSPVRTLHPALQVPGAAAASRGGQERQPEGQTSVRTQAPPREEDRVRGQGPCVPGEARPCPAPDSPRLPHRSPQPRNEAQLLDCPARGLSLGATGAPPGLPALPAGTVPQARGLDRPECMLPQTARTLTSQGYL